MLHQHPIKRCFWVFVCLVLVLVSAPDPQQSLPHAHAQGMTYTVNFLTDVHDGSCDEVHCSLRDAITEANNSPGPDIINFSVSGTLILQNAGGFRKFVVTDELTINGGGLVTLDGGGAIDIMDVDECSNQTTSTVTVRLNGLTIQNTEFGAICNGGILEITNSTFHSNSGAFSATAISNLPYGNTFLTITDSTFIGGTMTIINSSFISNTAAAYRGGAIYNGKSVVGGTGTATIINSTFSNNSAGTIGGAIYNSDGTLDIRGSTFDGNLADEGGAIGNGGNAGTGTVTITDSTFDGNSADYGGAVLNSNHSLTITRSTFSSNTAFSGGAISNGSPPFPASGGTAAITNSTFSGNSATNIGGAIYNTTNTTTITNSTLTILRVVTAERCIIIRRPSTRQATSSRMAVALAGSRMMTIT